MDDIEAWFIQRLEGLQSIPPPRGNLPGLSMTYAEARAWLIWDMVNELDKYRQRKGIKQMERIKRVAVSDLKKNDVVLSDGTEKTLKYSQYQIDNVHLILYFTDGTKSKVFHEMEKVDVVGGQEVLL